MNRVTDTDSRGRKISGSDAGHRWSVTRVALAHKWVAAGSIAIVLIFVAVTVVPTLSSPARQPITDSATCSQWASATPAQKLGYSHLYINEYGRVPNTVQSARAVETMISTACTQASYLGEADDISVLASIRHAF